MKRSLTKSALTFARTACQVGRKSFSSYSSSKSPRLYKQYQLFAILALRYFLKLDYRGTVQTLSEWSELRKVIGLRKDHLPDHSTLVKAHKRLIKKTNLNTCLRQLSILHSKQK